MRLEDIGRLVMAAGVILLLMGGSILVAARIGLPLGQLPGDIRVERPHGSLYFPLATSLLVSFVLTVVLNLLIRFLRK
jgi:predicted neutral ceramidase superfamily lipid hydrolase